MKAKKRTAANVLSAQICAMSSPFLSVEKEEKEDRRVVRSSRIRFFETVREKEMKGIIAAAARSVAALDISENDIYTDPKNVCTGKEVKQFRELVSESDSSLESDGGVWDVSRRSRMKNIPSCYGH